MATAAAELPDLCRVCILADCRTKATFNDNTILSLNSTGSSFLVTTPDGRCTRQLSEYALARHSPLLAAVLEFRNMHVELPCFCKPLARVLRSSFTLGYLVQDATWPCPSAALSAGLAQLQPDGKVAVSSEDGVAQVVLHGHRRRFAVCYPLLVAERPQEAKYEYVWQTQVFSVASHPPRWQPAVRAVLQAAAELDAAAASGGNAGAGAGAGAGVQFGTGAGERQGPAHGGEQAVAGTAVAAPLLGPDSSATDAATAAAAAPPRLGFSSSPGSASSPSAEPSSRRRTELPSALHCTRAGLAEALRHDGWWGEPSLSLLPPEEVVAFEWTPHATYQFLEGTGEVEVWVHADESCLATTRAGRFVAHYRGGGGTSNNGGSGGGASSEQLYAANCVPDAVWSRDQTCRYPLGALAAHALKLRSHDTSVTAYIAARLPSPVAASLPALGGATGGAGSRTRSRLPGAGALTEPLDALPASTEELFAAASDAVLEDSCVPGTGRFTAFEDGRVRAVFENRTLLTLSSGHSHCRLVLPDGQAVVVGVANPVGVEGYVEAVLDFARWAFKSPAERAAELRAQARVRAELLASQRMAQLCEFSATGALPPEAAATALAPPAASSGAGAAGAGGVAGPVWGGASALMPSREMEAGPLALPAPGGLGDGTDVVVAEQSGGSLRRESLPVFAVDGVVLMDALYAAGSSGEAVEATASKAGGVGSGEAAGQPGVDALSKPVFPFGDGDRQAMIEALLSANARLLERL
ncbi:hypothetical protein HYH02_006754 [Chlamydomonas schloesseri]|uniref:DUF4524 domain-containing protein n=1 Tax=Chlamydomonas schloesseri TaxID=2026947 RepID=A0A835WIC3_9CHLO|nr:hypothetical protein HYH02_006754 [Chlamydomonas schloesseri]|eukprot:KAG2448169.1 hypothetical protein HYH02_006754 [Chlamydomonas schloesseri]